MKHRRPVLFVAWLALAGTAAAQSRLVVVNGQRLSDAEVAWLARRACSEIPDGRYWLDLRSGAWGYAGGPQQGVVGELCNRNADGTEGPYATLRRAEEVANGYRQRGLRAVAFHNGDGYYVRVSR